MTKEQSDPIRLFGIILPNIPSLVFRFVKIFLKFKRDAKKGGNVFKKELIKQGLDKKTAEDLTDIYLEGSHLTKYILQITR